MSASRIGLVLTSLALLLLGCERPLSRLVDLESFRLFGGTFFSTPGQVTLKEIHMDNNIRGTEVVVEGKVVESGEYDTYMVIADDSARLLVVLTEMDEPGSMSFASDATKNVVRILGRVESGIKGMPFLTARSVNTRHPDTTKS